MSTASIFTFTESLALLPTFIVCGFGYSISEVAGAVFLPFLLGNMEPLALLEAVQRKPVQCWCQGAGRRVARQRRESRRAEQPRGTRPGLAAGCSRPPSAGEKP